MVLLLTSRAIIYSKENLVHDMPMLQFTVLQLLQFSCTLRNVCNNTAMPVFKFQIKFE